MVTVLRVAGLRVIIYLNDHIPAHVHLVGDGEAKIDLQGLGGDVTLVWVDGMTRGEVRRAIAVVREHQAMLLKRWEEIHGRAD